MILGLCLLLRYVCGDIADFVCLCYGCICGFRVACLVFLWCAYSGILILWLLIAGILLIVMVLDDLSFDFCC